MRFWVDDSLILPFTYERNGHMLAKCIACDEVKVVFLNLCYIVVFFLLLLILWFLLTAAAFRANFLVFSDTRTKVLI